MKKIHPLKKRPKNLWRNNLILLISIVIFFIIGPAISFINKIPVLTYLTLTALIYSSMYALDFEKKTFKILFILGNTCVVLLWSDLIFDNVLYGTIINGLIAAYMMIVSVSMIIHIAKSKEVNSDVILSSINGYLLLGIMGALALRSADLLTPDFPILSIQVQTGFVTYVYFSFVTLTTLGYGDITPIAESSRVICMLLSITGQLYLTIIIAMLVGKFLSSNKK
ncbi:hypothetical protein ES708_12221 [subsurface metagenome]